MTEPQTRQAIDLSGSTEFTEEDGGTYRAYFALLDIQGRGANEQEAFEALTEQLGVILSSDDEARETFSNWAQDHIIEQEISPEMLADDAAVSPLAAQAGKSFRELTTDTFDGAIASSTPVLVDFWAEWCKPCLMLTPILGELHDELRDRFDVAKLNVDEHSSISDRYGVQGIPCMILFRDGNEVGRIVGMAPKEHLRPQLVDLLEKV